MFRLLYILLVFAFPVVVRAQSDNNASEPKYDYQIYLTKPALEIRELLNNKTCEPINGVISEGKKSIIMHDYEKGSKVYVRVIYTDGTEDDFVRSPCFIDPVIL